MGFLAEYAKSGRSSCRACHGSIAKGALRLGTLVQSTRRSGMDVNWFHVACCITKNPNISEFEISQFDLLRAEDQQLLKKYLAGEIIPAAPELEQQRNNPTQENILSKEALDVVENSGEFYVEYAKSSRSHCISCQGKIVKNEVRISQKDYTSIRAKSLPMPCLDRWHHVECFAKHRANLEFYISVNAIPGFALLKWTDQQMLMQMLPPMQYQETVQEHDHNYSGRNNNNDQGFKRTYPFPEEKENHPASSTCSFEQEQQKEILHVEIEVDPVQEKAVQDQQNLLENAQQLLTRHMYEKEKLALILRENGQDVPISVDKMIERIADMMIFGALKRCMVCKGQFVLRPGIGYFCIGYISELAKCTKQTKEPLRDSFRIPAGLKNNLAFANYNFAPRTRIIPQRQEFYEPERKLPKIDKLPLLNYKFYISEILDPFVTQNIHAKVTEYGGIIAPRLVKGVVAMFSTMVEVTSMTKRMDFAESNSIPVLSVDFIHSLTTVGFELDVEMKKHLLNGWMSNFPSSSSPSFHFPRRVPLLAGRSNEFS